MFAVTASSKKTLNANSASAGLDRDGARDAWCPSIRVACAKIKLQHPNVRENRRHLELNQKCSRIEYLRS